MITTVIVCLLSYFVGNILGGKVLTYIFKEDFTNKGSKNIGARNAGRILGSKAFFFVLIIDFFKGFLVVISLKLLNQSTLLIVLAMFFVILGHIKPVINKFHGGKGVATFVGTLFALSPNLVFILALGVLLIAFITRSLTIGFYSTLPVLVYVYYLDFKSFKAILVLVLVIGLLYFVGRKDLRKAFNKYFGIKRRPIKRQN